MTIEEAFGIAVRRLRRERNFSQEKLSISSGLDRTFISNIEGGKQQPSLISIFALAHALGVSASRIIGEVEVILEINGEDKSCIISKLQGAHWLAPRETADHGADQSLNGSETILLADDEEVLLEMMATYFTDSGYTVIKARTGQEALSLFKEHIAEIKVIILDVIMPGLNGFAVHKEITSIKPDIPIILMSGYYPENLGAPPSQILRKPFPPNEILKKVRLLLEG